MLIAFGPPRPLRKLKSAALFENSSERYRLAPRKPFCELRGRSPLSARVSYCSRDEEQAQSQRHEISRERRKSFIGTFIADNFFR
jgi:hypothetical protein